MSLSGAQIVLMLGTSVSMVTQLVYCTQDMYESSKNVLDFKMITIPKPLLAVINYLIDVGTGQV